MPYLRCEACHAKALPIATRCPACEAPFEASLRAGARRMRPCPGCDSLLPGDAATCRWCGEAVAERRSRSLQLTGAAVLLLVAVGALAWNGARDGQVTFLPGSSAEVNLPRAEAAPPEAPTTTRTRAGSGEAVTDGPAGAEGTLAQAGTPMGGDAAPGTGSAAADDRTPDASAPADRVADARSVDTTDEAAPPAPGWVRAVARTFVNVRSSPGSDSEVRGVVSENDVVFLGDARGAWRQVRSGGVDGWVWEPLFTVASGGS